MGVWYMKENELISLTREQLKGKKVYTVFLWFVAIMFMYGLFQSAIIFVFKFLEIFMSEFAKHTSNSAINLNIDSEEFNIIFLFGTVFLTLICIFVRTKIQKASLKSMGFTKEKFGYNFLIGIAIGSVLIVSSFLVNLGLKSLTFTISDNVNYIFIILYFIGFVFIQGLSEEVFCRGFIMNELAAKVNVPTGIIVNSALFGFLHLLNPEVNYLAVLNTFLVGILFSLIYYYTENIWTVGFIHGIWNFFLGHVFGIAVSGKSSESSIMISTLNEKMALINGGSYGLEAGLVVTVVIIIAIVISIIFCKAKFNNNNIIQ
jgi:membrane protease YdiL (CAAX protease family)